MNRTIIYVLAALVVFLLVFGNSMTQRIDNLQQNVILAQADQKVYELWIEELR